MTKWEYKYVYSREDLDAAGREGWEAVGFYFYSGYTVLLKRPLDE